MADTRFKRRPRSGVRAKQLNVPPAALAALQAALPRFIEIRFVNTHMNKFMQDTDWNVPNQKLNPEDKQTYRIMSDAEFQAKFENDPNVVGP